MPLFGRAPAAQAVATEPTTPPAQDVESIVTRVLERIVPILNQSHAPAVPVEPQAMPDEPAEPDDPADVARITRIARGVTTQMVGNHAAIFERSMPAIIRQSVVAMLSEGQKIIYERYKKEVDDGLDRACGTNAALRAVPEIHENAIRLMLGNHADDIERLVLERATPADMPPTFSMPNAGSVNSGRGTGEPSDATTDERQWVDFYSQRSRHKDWTVETMREFKSIKPGFMHEMIAQYRAAQREKENS